MRLAYSTYGLQQIDPAEAIDRVATMGYQALELNVGDDWPTAPAKLGAAARQKLREGYLAAGDYRELEERFGDMWRQYAARVPRYLPRRAG